MRRIKNRIFFVLLFFILFFAIFLLFVPWAGAQEKNNVKYFFWKDTWHDAGGNTYNYRIPIEISSRSRVNNYQICLTLTPENFNYTHAKPQGEDIRFVAEREGKLVELPYWIEKWNPKGRSLVWVKVPQIGKETKIYLYYGNKEGKSKSNAKDVFEFLDDFEAYPVGKAISGRGGWVVNAGEWIIAKGPNGKKCLLVDTKGSSWWKEWNFGIWHPLSVQDNIAVDLEVYIEKKHTNDPLVWILFRDYKKASYAVGLGGWYGLYVIAENYNTGGGAWRIKEGNSSKIPIKKWIKLTFTVNGSIIKMKKIEGGEIFWEKATRKKGEKIGISLRALRVFFDNFKVRKYMEPEPSFILGKEEAREIEKIEEKERLSEKEKKKILELLEKLEKEIEYLKMEVNQLEEKINFLTRMLSEK